VVQRKQIDVSEEHIDFVISVEEQTKKETSMMEAANRALLFWLLVWFALLP
jgi:hypothetical protein